MFRGKQKREDAEHQLEQEVERLKALSPQQVGVELIKLVEPFDLDPDAFPVGALAKCWRQATDDFEGHASRNSCSL